MMRQTHPRHDSATAAGVVAADHSRSWYGEPIAASSLRPSARRPAPRPVPAYGAPPPGQPHAAPPAAAAEGASQPAQGRRRRWTELTAVAPLAAVLASGTTYAVDPAATSPRTPRRRHRVDQPRHRAPAPVTQANAHGPRLDRHRRRRLAQRRGDHRQDAARAAAQGSGVIIDAKGHVAHQQPRRGGGRRPAELTVTLTDGRTYNAEVVGTDPSTDLAVITLNNAPSDLTPDRARRLRQAHRRRPGHGRRQPARPGRHRHHRHRQRAQPPGHHQPGATTSSRTRSASSQQQRRAGRDQRDPDHRRDQPRQQRWRARQRQRPARSASTPRSPRSAPRHGGQRAAASASASPSRSTRPSSIAEQLIAGGTAEHAYLGVSPAGRHRPATARPAAPAPRSPRSVGGTPAAKAGLKKGDAIVAVDGEPVDSGRVARRPTSASARVGDKVTLTVLRDGKRQDIQATLAAKPSTGQ